MRSIAREIFNGDTTTSVQVTVNRGNNKIAIGVLAARFPNLWAPHRAASCRILATGIIPPRRQSAPVQSTETFPVRCLVTHIQDSSRWLVASCLLRGWKEADRTGGIQ